MSLQHVANHLAQQGRGNDKMLVHMTPSEVAGLRSLAQAKGGDLTINPHTGLPEAGALDDIIKVAAPIALGALLGPAGMGLTLGGLSSAATAGLITGGISTLATGSLSRGLMAGLGAYGGAGLAEGLAGAGEATLGTGAGLPGINELGREAASTALEEAGTVATPPPSLDANGDWVHTKPIANVGDEAIAANDAATNIAKDLSKQATPWEKIGSGVKTVTQSPGAALDFAKNNWQSGLAAMAPFAAVQNTSGATAPPVNTGYIRQKIYDPVTHRTIDLEPVKASEWGSRKFSDIYQQPTAAATGGIVALAQGGVAHFAGDAGSSVAALANPTAEAVSSFQGLATADPAAYNTAINNAVQAAQAQFGGDNAQSRAAIANEMNQWGVGVNPVAQALGTTVGNIQADYNAVAPTGMYATSSLTNPGNSAISNQAIVDAVNSGASWDSLQQQMVQNGVSINQAAKALGMSPAEFAKDYALTTGIQGEGKLLGQYQGPGTPLSNLGSTYDQQWAKYMDDKMAAGINANTAIKQMSSVTNIPIDQITARYNAAEAAMKVPPATPIVPPATKIGTAGNATAPVPGTSNATQTVLPTNSGTNAPAGTANPYGNQNNPGDVTFNADGSKTAQPNIPGRPYGGFSGMNEVVKNYTAGGGSTGYFPPAPKTMAEFNNQFNTMTGDSLAAYNYLTGKGAAPIKSAAPVISGSYAEKVLGIAPDKKTYASNIQYIFDPVTHKKVLNPAYDSVAAAAAKVGSNTSGTAPATNAGKTISIPVANGTPPRTATQLTDYPGIYYGVDGLYYDANGNVVTDPTQQAANGGLMGMAHGGTARAPFFSKTTGKFNFNPPQVYADGGMAMGGLGSLGGYSDGGRLLRGPGDGVSDSIPASIGNRQPARLADGEFVVPARIVSEIGNGSTEAGARKLYAMMDRVQNARAKTTGKKQVATNTNAAKYLPV